MAAFRYLRKIVLIFGSLVMANGLCREPLTINAILTTEGLVFDPAKAKGYQQFQVLNLMLDTLVRKDPSLGLVSGLAKKWTVSTDQTIYTFWIDDRARFSSGDIVMPSDIVYSFRRQMEKNSGSIIASYLNQAIDEIKSEDKDKVVFKLKGPYPPFLELISMAGLGILSQKSTAENVLGSGPFVLDSYKEGQWCLKPNSQYQFRRPKPDRYCFRIERDVSRTIHLLKSGEANLAMGSPLEVALHADAGSDFVSSPTFSLVGTHFYFNHTREIFKTVANRKKIRDIIIQARSLPGVLTRFDSKLDHFIPAGIMPDAYYSEIEKTASGAIENSRSKLKIVFPYGILLNSAVEIIVKKFRDSGFVVDYLNVKGKDLLAPIVSGDFDLIMVPYQGVVSDPDGYLDMIQPDSIMSKASTPSANLLAQLERLRFLPDRSSRLSAYSNALKQWEKDIPVVPFSQNAIPIVHRKNVRLPNLNNSYHLNLREIFFE